MKITKEDLKMIMWLLVFITLIFGPILVLSEPNPPRWLLIPAGIIGALEFLFVIYAGLIGPITDLFRK